MCWGTGALGGRRVYLIHRCVFLLDFVDSGDGSVKVVPCFYQYHSSDKLDRNGGFEA